MTNCETAQQIWKEIDESMVNGKDIIPTTYELKAQAKQHLEDCERFLSDLCSVLTNDSLKQIGIGMLMSDIQSAMKIHKERLGEKK